MTLIALRENVNAVIDDEDAPLVEGYRWTAHPKGPNTYAVTKIDGHMVRMHRLILGAKEDEKVDHRDRNGLNNQRINLRLSSVSENNRNRRMLTDKARTTSQYKGVMAVRGRWQSSIGYEGKKIPLGKFRDEKMAAHAYDVAALIFHKEHAATNHELLGITYDPQQVINASIRRQVKLKLPAPPKERRGEKGFTAVGQRFISPTKASPFKGVTREKNIWRSTIKTAGGNKVLGFHTDQETAAHAYDVAALLVHEKPVTNHDILGIAYDPRQIMAASISKSLKKYRMAS